MAVIRGSVSRFQKKLVGLLSEIALSALFQRHFAPAGAASPPILIT